MLTSENELVLAVTLATGKIRLRSAGLYLAAGQIAKDRLETLAVALYLPRNWTRHAEMEVRAAQGDDRTENFGPRC